MKYNISFSYISYIQLKNNNNNPSTCIRKVLYFISFNQKIKIWEKKSITLYRILVDYWCLLPCGHHTSKLEDY